MKGMNSYEVIANSLKSLDSNTKYELFLSPQPKTALLEKGQKPCSNTGVRITYH